MASINTSSNDSIYLAFRSAGPSADLIVPAVALYLVVLVGITLNSTVLVITVKSSSLRGSANFLMALICLCEFVHQIGHTFFLVIVLSGINFVSLLTADIIMAPSIFALNCGLMAMFCAAFDRLFAILSPFQHKTIFTEYKYSYLLSHLSICTIYGAFSLYYVFDYAIENAGIPVTGFVADCLVDEVSLMFLYGTMILCLASMCCYLAIFGIIRCKKGVTQQTNTRLLRSLIIIFSVNTGGYVINLSMYNLMFEYGDILFSEIRIWQACFVSAILLNIISGSNAIVLYFNSTEYRNEFKKAIRLVFRCFSKNNDRLPNGTPNFINNTRPRNVIHSIHMNRY